MDVVIIGCGGHGREMAQLIKRMQASGQDLHPAGFVDDNAGFHGRVIEGLPVLGGTDWISNHVRDHSFVCAIGNPKSRQDLVRRLSPSSLQWATLIDPAVRRSDDSVIGEGAMVCAGTWMTTNARIGRHTIVNLGCTLSHDINLGDFATLACGVHLSGNVTIGEGAELGVGVNVIQGITIGEWSVIGAGATVINDIPPRVTALGVPAKVVKEHR